MILDTIAAYTFPFSLPSRYQQASKEDGMDVNKRVAWEAALQQFGNKRPKTLLLGQLKGLGLRDSLN